jgi:spermidine synthase
MSSQFTKAEIELARLGLAALGRGGLDIVVGGLGSATPRNRLENPDVRSLIVVDALAEVIEWHEQGLLPLGKQLTGDPRCRLVNGDFFVLSASDDGFDSGTPRRRFDAVLVDIDHSPRNLLHPRHAALYEPRAGAAGRASAA